MKRVAIVIAGSGAGNSAMVDYLKNKISHIEAEIEVIQADQLPEAGRICKPLVFDSGYEIEEIKVSQETRSLKEHRGKHRTHKNKYGR